MDKKHYDGAGRSGRSTKRHWLSSQHPQEAATTFASTSAKKLETSNDEEIPMTPGHRYRIIEFLSVFTAISQLVICRKCQGEVQFCEDTQRGLGFKISVQCNCKTEYINSGPLIDNKSYDINLRIVFVMRLLGISRHGINLFCGLMDISQGLSNTLYYAALETIHGGAKAVYNILTRKAAEEEKTLNSEHGEPRSDISVSGDGTWKKRGFTSLFGITTLIGKYSGKVIDLIVKSSHCLCCSLWESKCGTEEYNNWLDEHVDSCEINHDGSAGAMEAESVKEMFRRSWEWFQVRYTTYIGDGDTETFKGLLNDKPYGENCPVKKRECIGHVAKRMGTRLRDVKEKRKLGGKGKLTNKLIKDLSMYYGLAIRRNSDSVENMYDAVWAIFYHKISTNDNPQHMHCPVGPGSWCSWRRAEAENTLDKYKHEPPLHAEVEDCLRPIFESLSSKDLLERCLGGETQNSNESFNSTVWRFAPKHLHCGAKTIEIAAFLATGIFNEGWNAILKTMATLGIVIGEQAKLSATTGDQERLERSARRTLEATKEARTKNRREQMDKNIFYKEEEGVLYGPGIAD